MNESYLLAIDPETRNLLQTRPAFGGNIMATIVTPNHRPQMATVMPRVMKKLQPAPLSGAHQRGKLLVTAVAPGGSLLYSACRFRRHVRRRAVETRYRQRRYNVNVIVCFY